MGKVKKYKDYLKQKAISLDLECKNIRRMEQKRLHLAVKARRRGYDDSYHLAVYEGLHEHRVEFLRKINRAVTIALGFLNGHEYSQIEQISYSQPDWNHIESLVREYGEGNENERMDNFGNWKVRALNSILEMPSGGQRYTPGEVLRPGSVKEINDYNRDWVLRNHNGNQEEWNRYWDDLHPKREKKPSPLAVQAAEAKKWDVVN